MEKLDSETIERKLEKLDSSIRTAKNLGGIDPDFELEAALIGSAYIIDLASQQGKHIEYEDTDVDLFIPDDESVKALEKSISHFYEDAVEGQYHVNVSRDWSAPLEIETQIPYELGLPEQKRMVEQELEEDIHDPLATVYSGDHLRVHLPHPDTYADTKHASNEEHAEIYHDQLRTIDYILENNSLLGNNVASADVDITKQEEAI